MQFDIDCHTTKQEQHEAKGTLVNVLYTFDNNYVQHAIASMVSICRTNSWDTALTFFVLADSLTKDNLKIVKSLEEEFPCKVEVAEINGFMSQFESGFDTKGWNEVIMARLLMGRFLPASVMKVLYLDGDTIVRNSLKELWNTDLGDNCLGAVVEPTVDRARMHTLGLERKPYFNSGILLVDLGLWRERHIEDKILALCAQEGDKLVAGDQDALNLVMNGEFQALSPTYNYSNSFYYYPYELLVDLEKPAHFIEAPEFRAIQESPTIIHYLGEDRPWRKGTTHRFALDYWENVRMSPFAPYAREEEGWELYFKAWGAFNALVKPFPRLRLQIIQSLIPPFLRFRTRQRKKGGK